MFPPSILTIENLGLPNILHSFSSLKQGFILVCGPTGHGKSSTLAAIINEINQTRPAHVLTIEDPIEFRLQNLNDKKIQRVIKTAAEKFGWKPQVSLEEGIDKTLKWYCENYETHP